MDYLPPEASFLAWLDCRELDATGAADATGTAQATGTEDAMDPTAIFLDRGRVGVTSGTGFGEQGRGFVRLNMGTSPDSAGGDRPPDGHRGQRSTCHVQR